MKDGCVIGFDIGGTNIKFATLTPKGTEYLARGGIANAPYIGLELEHIVKHQLSIKEDISCVGVITSYSVSSGDYYKRIKQKEIEKYYPDIASLFLCDLQVMSYHNLCLEDTNFVLTGIGKDILLKKVLTLLEVSESHTFDAADVPGSLWAHGSSLGAAFGTLDHCTGEHILLSDVKGESP